MIKRFIGNTLIILFVVGFILSNIALWYINTNDKSFFYNDLSFLLLRVIIFFLMIGSIYMLYMLLTKAVNSLYISLFRYFTIGTFAWLVANILHAAYNIYYQKSLGSLWFYLKKDIQYCLPGLAGSVVAIYYENKALSKKKEI